MKKNRMMRLASGLLVAVLITTSTISGTFAKYVTEDSAKDEARVAKFGVTVTATGDMFDDNYESGDVVSYASTLVGYDPANPENVLAPGTEKTNAMTFTVTGQPEVKVATNYEATVTLANWGDYCPLIFTVDGVTYGTVDTTATNNTYADATALAAALDTLIESRSATYDANKDLTTETADNLTISWEWPFSTSAANDVKDTALGDAAATGTAATVVFDVKCTVTQIGD